MAREVIHERGWVHTGDIGCWNADGKPSIIDRKKNIFMLAQGRTDSLQTCLEHGFSGDNASKAKVLANPEYQKDVRDDTERVTKAAQLRVVERVRNVDFHPKSFSSDDDLVTPTVKLKRPQLKAYFQPQIDELYKELQAVICDETKATVYLNLTGFSYPWCRITPRLWAIPVLEY
ncbi:Long-chain-fatty-acid-CoA ligase [Phytophthora cinnamomi]|uniref:Long-chain-fatty-acid-CoA ligase n=1 Tax=Phytophthora cinnamomi TaxID=4785 RepID=UPI003559F2BB|nr:Long-chain-fatty-acid-CoA ligase [Phytophthora cinnamomi]